MARSRSENSKFSETPSKTALRGRRTVARGDQRTGPSSRAKKRIQGLETVPHPSGRPLASETELLKFRRTTPKAATQPRGVIKKAEAAKQIVRTLRRQGR